MEESASDCPSRENATGVDWNKLPSELWLEIFSYMSPVNIVGVLRYVSTLFESCSFHPSLWRQIDLTDWNGPTTHLVRNESLLLLLDVNVLNFEGFFIPRLYSGFLH